MARRKQEGSISKYKTAKKGVMYRCKLVCKNKKTDGSYHIITGTGKTEDEARKKAIQRRDMWDKSNAADNDDDSRLNYKFNEDFLKWIEEYGKSRDWAGSTLLNRKQNAKVWFDDWKNKKVRDIKEKELKSKVAYIFATYDFTSAKNMYYLLTYYFDDLYDSGIILDNYMAKVSKPPKKAKKQVLEVGEDTSAFIDDEIIFNEDEIKAGLDYLDDPVWLGNDDRRAYRYVQLFAVLFLTGLRSQEIRALEVDDIDFENHTIRINKALSVNEDNETIIKLPKSNSGNRIIGINEDCETALKHLIENRYHQDSKILIQNGKGGYFERRNFMKLFNEILNFLGIEKKGRGAHALRHTFISYAIEKNELSPLKDKEISFISRYAGHSSVDITLRVYTHIQSRKIKAITYREENEEEVLEIQNDEIKWE